MKKAVRKQAKVISADIVFAKVRKNPAYAKAYRDLDKEFGRVVTRIKARTASR